MKKLQKKFLAKKSKILQESTIPNSNFGSKSLSSEQYLNDIPSPINSYNNYIHGEVQSFLKIHFKLKKRNNNIKKQGQEKNSSDLYEMYFSKKHQTDSDKRISHFQHNLETNLNIKNKYNPQNFSLSSTKDLMPKKLFNITTKKSKIFKKKTSISELSDKNKRTIFIGNLPLNKSQLKELYKHLNISQKDIESIRFRSIPIHPKFRSNIKLGVISNSYNGTLSTQNAYIVLRNPNLIPKILNKNNSFFNGTTLRIDLADKGSIFSIFDIKKTIFIGNLPLVITDDELREAFNSIGSIQGIRIIRDRATALSKGFGFVLFADRKSVVEALKAQGSVKIKDHILRITRSQKQENLKDIKTNFFK